jgi:hypothetical protein
VVRCKGCIGRLSLACTPRRHALRQCSVAKVGVENWPHLTYP